MKNPESRTRITRFVVTTALLSLVLWACGDGSPSEPASEATSVAITQPSQSLDAIGASLQLSVQVRDQNGDPMPSASVTWSSSAPGIAAVDQQGLVTAGSAGTATITARAGSASGTLTLTVELRPATVEVSPATETLIAGRSVGLSAQVRDANGNAIPNATVNWSSGNPGIASVGSSDGTVEALAAGETTIVASAGSASGTATITVLQRPVATVNVTPDALELEAGATGQLSVTLQAEDGTTLTNREVSWESSSPSVASVSSGGEVSAESPGTATITVTSEGIEGTATVEVIEPRPDVASVQISPSTLSLTEGESGQLTATPRAADGTALTDRTVAWSSSNAGVAQVSGSGAVNAISPGTAWITARSEGVEGSARINVEEESPPIASVTVQGAPRAKVGDSYNYSATARYADGTIANVPITWDTPNPSRAHMTSSGVLTPLATGSITLRATVEGTVWSTTVDAYDWVYLSDSNNRFLYIPADLLITNRHGTSEYPEVVLSCNLNSGKFFAWVSTDNFITDNGWVAYNFDGGSTITQQWIEFSNYSSLGHPGPTNLQTKNFATAMASSNTFGFAFTEFNGPARATIFRVTGLNSLVGPLLDGCPNNSLIELYSSDQGTDGDLSPTAFEQVRSAYSLLRAGAGQGAMSISPEIAEERARRGELGAGADKVPELVIDEHPVRQIELTRVRPAEDPSGVERVR